MIIEITDSTITLPDEIVKAFNLSKGDLLDFEIKDGGIFIVPITK